MVTFKIRGVKFKIRCSEALSVRIGLQNFTAEIGILNYSWKKRKTLKLTEMLVKKDNRAKCSIISNNLTN